MKRIRVLIVCAIAATSAMGGTIQQNLGFDPEGTFIVKQGEYTGSSSGWSYPDGDVVIVGQSFHLTQETTLRAVTLAKAGDWTYSDGTNALSLWVGEYSTNGVISSTNLLETFNMTGITLTNGSHFSLNLDEDLVLPVGDYAFQVWFERGEQGRLTFYKGDQFYDGGTMLRAGRSEPGTVEEAGLVGSDLTFALHSEVVGEVSNVLPIAEDQEVSTVPNVDLSLTLTGIDPEGVSNLVYTVIDSPTNGTLSGTAPDLIYEPDTDFQGMDRFTFSVNDGVYTSVAATVLITVTNIPPTASPQDVSTQQDVALEITLAGIDPEGSHLTYAVIDQPADGWVSATDTNVLTYTPNSGFSGTDHFTFTVNDGVHESEPATVAINVIPVGMEVSFHSLSADSSSLSNLLNVAGSTIGLSLSRVYSDGDYVYSISYTDADYDGDAQNDTLSFDVRVAAVNGTTASFSTEPGASTALIGSGNETVGDAADNPIYGNNPSGLAWVSGVGTQGTVPGDSYLFTIENISVTGTGIPYEGALLGFDGLVVAEYTGSAHQTILGAGTGLNGYEWSGASQAVTGFAMSPLYVTGTASYSGMRWGVSTVDFTLSVAPEPWDPVVEEMSSMMISASQIALSWPTRQGVLYGIQARDDLIFGSWSNVVTGVLGTGGEVIITNDITESQQFYRAFLDE